jgi:hypothetical protein
MARLTSLVIKRVATLARLNCSDSALKRTTMPSSSLISRERGMTRCWPSINQLVLRALAGFGVGAPSLRVLGTLPKQQCGDREVAVKRDGVGLRDFVGLCDDGPMVNRRRKTKSSETHRDRQRLAPGVVPVRPIARLLLAAWATRPWHRAGRETPATRSTPERPAIGSLLFARFLNVKRFVVERW